MLDAAILPLQRRVLDAPAKALARAGVTADTITIVSFVIGLLVVPAVALGMFWVALAALAINRIGDGLDGSVARHTMPTDRGAFLDITLDFFFYGIFPVGFAIYDPANALAAAVLIAAFVGTGSSFLAFAIIAEKRGQSSLSYPSKGIYYLGGLTEGFETITVFAAMCIFPWAFQILAYAFAIACLLTMLTRWYLGWTTFGSDDQAGR